MSNQKLNSLVQQINTTKDEKDLNKVLIQLGKYTDNREDDEIQEIIETNCHQKLIELLSHESITIYKPSLRILTNIITIGNESQTQIILNCNFLSKLVPLLKSTDKSLLIDVYNSISNIIAGSRDQIQMILNETIIFENVISTLLNSSTDKSIKFEAIWSISNIFTSPVASIDQKNFIINSYACIHAICKTFLETNNNNQEILVTIETILTTNEINNMNKIIALFNESGIINKLIELESKSNNIELCEKSSNIRLLLSENAIKNLNISKN